MEDHGNKLAFAVLAVTAPIWGSLLLAAFVHYHLLKKKGNHPWNLTP
jgi:hypothetical protein